MVPQAGDTSAYQASEQAKVDKWLSFEADYHNHLDEIRMGVA